MDVAVRPTARHFSAQDSESCQHSSIVVVRFLLQAMAAPTTHLEVQGLQQLLKEHLSEEDFQSWTVPHLENLLGKGFATQEALRKATIRYLQAGPGPALPLILIESLLKALNPDALLTSGGSLDVQAANHANKHRAAFCSWKCTWLPET